MYNIHELKFSIVFPVDTSAMPIAVDASQLVISAPWLYQPGGLPKMLSMEKILQEKPHLGGVSLVEFLPWKGSWCPTWVSEDTSQGSLRDSRIKLLSQV